MIKNAENEIIKLHEEGKTSAEISKLLNIQKDKVRHFLIKKDLKPNVKQKFGTYSIQCSVCSTDFIPKSRKTITCSNKCKSKLISKGLTNYAENNGARNSINEEKADLLIEMYNKGLSLKEMVLATDIEVHAIRQFLSRKIKDYKSIADKKYTKRMSEEDMIIVLELNKNGVHISDISKTTGYSKTSLKDFLKKQGQKHNVAEDSYKYSKNMDDEVKNTIIELHSQGKNSTEIAKVIGYSPTSVRNFLEEISVKPNIHILDRSRPCSMCGKIYVPASYDSKNKRYTLCSKECISKNFKIINAVYTPEQVQNVIDLLKQGFSNETVEMKTGVKRNKIIKIVQEHKLYKSNTPGSSAPEEEVRNYIKSLGLDAPKHRFPDNGEYGGKEIDMLITLQNGQKIGIEYCGIYWHSEGSKGDLAKKMHINKLKKANEKGISLITIFSDEWVNRQDQVKSFLKSKLHKNSIKKQARNLTIKEVSKDEASDFLEKYHIQGSSNILVAFGLYEGEDLLSVMTGNIHHRNNVESNILVLSRLCFKEDVSIAGGSSRLLSKLLDYAKNNGYKKIISWSDNRWSEGNVYKSLGFNLEKDMPEDYSYAYGNKRINKQACTKQALLKKGAKGNTEKEMACSISYYRIWDCGKKRWVLKID